MPAQGARSSIDGAAPLKSLSPCMQFSRMICRTRHCLGAKVDGHVRLAIA
jgi:hypothetical protein